LEALERQLLKQYPLIEGDQPGTRLRYAETLTYLHYLDFIFRSQDLLNDCLFKDHAIKEPLRWLDVGAKNWAYVPALNTFLKTFASWSPLDEPAYELVGIELDAYRVYANLFSRYDYAMSFTQHMPQAQYLVGDVMVHRQQYHIISHFLPFVVPEPCLKWGLPLSCFQPQAMLNHVLSLLIPGGFLIIMNQGEWERDAQQALFDRLPETTREQLTIQAIGQMPASFLEYTYPRFGWLVRKSIIHDPTSPDSHLCLQQSS
jgi:hypothetical protein